MNYKRIILLVLLIIGALSAELLQAGETAPGFMLKSEKGEYVVLDSLLQNGKSVLLVFYPGDNTPVCTKQLCELNDNYESLQEAGITVLGINPADSASHAKFSSKQNYNFDLLTDNGLGVAKQYGAKGALGVKRSVFLIGSDKKILFSSKGKPKSVTILEYAK